MHTLPDITGADATVGLGNPAGARASWVKFIVQSNGPVRIGDTNTASDRGWPVSAGDATGGILELPWRGQLTWYAMDQLRVYVPSGATVTVVYAD